VEIFRTGSGNVIRNGILKIALFNEAPPLKEDGAFFLVLLARLLCHRLIKKAVNEKWRGYVMSIIGLRAMPPSTTQR
jgi:uncharacterized membrane protein YiaA